MDEAPEIDVERIRERIRQNLRTRREEPAPPDPTLPHLHGGVAADVAEVQRLRSLADTPGPSHRRLLGPFVVLAKKTLHTLLSPILRRQADYNRANARIVSALWQWTDWMAREQTAMLRALHRDLSRAVLPGGEVSRVAALEQAVLQLQAELAGQRQRIAAALDNLRVRDALPLAGRPGAEDIARLDALYVAIEDAFRGDRAEIKRRLAVYLPLVKQARIGGDVPILDLGCGRGEWLELLREHGVPARGVDRNRLLLEDCRSRGLDVVEGDVPDALQAVAASSVGVVTCFHVVEHLPFAALIALLDETVRVLKPGGLAIFETPDPQNLLVASQGFHLDPTHHRPLPSPMMKFLAEARGLGRVEIMRLNPEPAALHVAEEANADVARRFNEYFYGPKDYGLIGWKP